MASMFGMNGSGQWQDEGRPKSWREKILYWFVNGKAPLTAMSAKLTGATITDPNHYWWTQTPAFQVGSITDAYLDVLSTPVSAATTAADTTVYLKIDQTTQAFWNEVRIGQVVMVQSLVDPSARCNLYVTAKTLNGASSYLTATVLSVDNGGLTAATPNITVIGNMNAEGATVPTNMVWQPTKFYNYTQIFRDSLKLTGTAEATKTRYGSPEYLRQKKQTLEQHAFGQERSFLWGKKYEANGGPAAADASYSLRAMDGVVTFCEDHAAASKHAGRNVQNFLTEVAAGTTWKTQGKDVLNAWIEQIFRYGDSERFCFCGNGAVAGINILAELYGQMTITPMITSYGIKVVNWVTPFGEINLKTHPLFNLDSIWRNAILAFNPKTLKWCPLKGRDTHFISCKTPGGSGETSIDGRIEEYLTEGTLELGIPEESGILYNVGVDA